MQPLFTATSAHIRCVRSFFVSSSCYVTAPLAMYIKSETVGGMGVGGVGGGGGGEGNKKQVSALIWSAHAVGSCSHNSCFRTPTRVIFTEMAAKNAYFPCV